MKNSLLVMSTFLLMGGAVPAMADPGRWDKHASHRGRIQIYVDNQHGYGNGYGYGRGYGHHGNNRGRSHGHGWGLTPWVAAAAVGTTIYWANTHTPTTTVIVSPPVVVEPARVAYFCQTAQQYYPTVSTCNVPWQLVSF